MKRRTFLKCSSKASAVAAVAPILGIDAIFPADYQEYDIANLQKLMASGSLSSFNLTNYYLDRIEKIDRSGPQINSVIEVNPEARSIARSLDQERRQGKVRGPLHGIPVLVKDNINTGDRMMTTAGSLALLGHHAKNDAFIIGRLREAGAVLLGKTNLSEWANFRSTRSASGWSSRGGQTRNPYCLDRTPSGSSAGSGAAVASNLCVLAIGSETDGSIVSPASVCGLVGIKPTVGLLSRAGIIPISASQDTAGPMARTVRDAAILLSGLQGLDLGDPETLKIPKTSAIDYASSLQLEGLKGRRIGLDTSLLGKDEKVDALFHAAVSVMKGLGAEFVDLDVLKAISPFTAFEGTLLSFEFKAGLNNYLEKEGFKYSRLEEIISFNRLNEHSVMPFFGQEIFIKAQQRGSLESPEYLDAKNHLQNGSRKAIDDLLALNRLDAICSPTNGLPGLIDQINGDYDTGYGFSTAAAVCGYPHVTVPMGLVHELPVGISFMGTAWTERRLIELAYAYEQGSKARRAPKFLRALNPL